MNDKSRGRDKDLVRNSSVKSGRLSVDPHNFDTQRNLAIDLAGTLENISIDQQELGLSILLKSSQIVFHVERWLIAPTTSAPDFSWPILYFVSNPRITFKANTKEIDFI